MSPPGTRDVVLALAAARTRLVLDRPFLGALVMHLSLAPAPPRACPTVATDGRTIYFNPAYIGGLAFEHIQFVLAHEALHCALSHFARRGHRVARRWDVACDYAVNQLLVDDGLAAPDNALLNPGFRGMSAEEIYPLLPEQVHERTLDRHGFDRARDGAPGDTEIEGGAASDASDSAFDALTVGEDRAREATAAARDDEALEVQWQTRLASAAQQAMRAGRLGEMWRRALDGFIQPQLSWRALLQRFLQHAARDDYSFSRLSRREGPALLPRLHSARTEIVAVVDTSGSISPAEMAAFLAEIDSIKGQIAARITLHACDERLCPNGPWVFETWERLSLPDDISGGGGTSLKPPFDWVDRAGIRPDVLLYFTDAEGEFPERAPSYPVLWLVKGRAPVPWGARVQLN